MAPRQILPLRMNHSQLTSNEHLEDFDANSSNNSRAAYIASPHL